jgi:branched-chain amino acid transport system permease protein
MSKYTIAFLSILLVILFLLPLVAGEYLLHMIVLVLLYAYLATAWNILGGYAGQHSLGHGVFFGIGAYVSTFLFVQWRITPWLGMWVGGAVSALVGWFIGYVCFRYGLKGPYFALVTIALAEAFVYLTSNVAFIGGAKGLEVTWLGHRPDMMEFDGKAGYYYIILVMTILGVLVTRWIYQRRSGYQWIAVRENEDAAEALGVDTLRAKIEATVLSALMTAIGGTFYAQYFTYIGPRSVFGEGPSVQILLFAIIGGLGTVWGPLVGAIVLVPIAELARAKLGGSFGGAHLMLYGTVMVLVMLFMPKGIVGLAQNVYARLTRRQPDSAPSAKEAV